MNPVQTGKVPKDVNKLAAFIVRSATANGKDPLAVELGRRGGKARASSLSASKKSEIARQGAKSRWAKAKARKGN